MPETDRELLRDAIDLHAHTAPALFNRPIDDLDLAELARDYRMRGFVLKDHDMQTTGRAQLVRRAHPEVEPIGAIVLNRSVGGLDPHVVEAALHYGARVIFMPSNHSQWHSEYYQGISDYPQFGRRRRQLAGAGVSVLDSSGHLTQETGRILDLIADADACVATSHLSLAEIRVLQDEAIRRGVGKFVVTHANWALSRLDLDVQRELIAKGAYLEYVASAVVSPLFHEQEFGELAEWIRHLGGDRLVLSSDLGQSEGPHHPEGLRQLVAGLLDAGAPYAELEKMTKVNPAVLLGLTP